MMFGIGAGTGLVGLLLLVVQTARALSGNTLGSLATVLLWVGVGLLVVGGVLLVATVMRLDRGQPADG